MNSNCSVTELAEACRTLTVFRTIREQPLFAAFEKLLNALNCRIVHDCADLFAAFLALLAEKNVFLDWKTECAVLFLANDNPYTRACESEDCTPQLEFLACNDCKCLEKLASVTLAQLEYAVRDVCNSRTIAHSKFEELPPVACVNSEHDNPAASRFEKMLSVLCKKNAWHTAIAELKTFWHDGAGVFVFSAAFVWKNGTLEPVFNCAPVPFDCLYGYEAPRSVVLENTMRFAAGHRANNLLLYGDRGTGKSATVKSIAAFFAGSDAATKNRLRIVEVRKEQLDEFSRIAEELARRNFRFIVFIDDLSFNETDERYIGLKALLEGGLASRPANVILYATSNRRHLVKEKAADRAGLGSLDANAEIRAEDAVQEHLSLADRFGMTIIFSSPNQDEYLHLVFSLLNERDLRFDADTVRIQALRWEKWYNGRSPRTACQFADWFASGAVFPWDLHNT